MKYLKHTLYLSIFVALIFTVNVNEVNAVAISPEEVPLGKLSGSTGALLDHVDVSTFILLDHKNTDVVAYESGGTEYVFVTYSFGGEVEVARYTWSGSLGSKVSLNDDSPASISLGGFDDDISALEIDSSGTLYVIAHQENADQDYYLVSIDSALTTVGTPVVYDAGGTEITRGAFIDSSDSIYITSKEQFSDVHNVVKFAAGLDSSGPSFESVGAAPFTALSGASHTTNGAGDIEYQLSNDGETWYYHNGSAWVTESGGGYPTETNDIDELNTNVSSFSAGDLFFRAFLKSDGATDPQLEEFTISLGAGAISGTGAVEEDIAVYQSKWFPKIPQPISAKPTPGTSDCIDFTFSTRIADDDNPFNDPDKFILWGPDGSELTNSGVNAVPKVATYSLQKCGYEPNSLVRNVSASSTNGSGESGRSGFFPNTYTLPEIPEFEVIPFIPELETESDEIETTIGSGGTEG